MDAVQVWWCKASCSTVDAIVVLWIFSTLWKLCNSIHMCGCKVFIVFLWVSKFFVDCIPHMTKSIFSWAYQHTQRERERERVIFVLALFRLLLLPFVPLLYVLSAARERETALVICMCKASLPLCMCIDLCGRRNKKLNAKKLSNFHSKL